jgi:hypothetical protein
LSNWDTYRQYNALADQLLAAATPEQLAESLRILAMNVAHYKSRFGDAPTDDLSGALLSGKVDDGTVAILASSMENLVGVLGTVMGLDQPNQLN